jgi:cobalt-zinc-cadmium efflux system membrane fusion protein
MIAKLTVAAALLAAGATGMWLYMRRPADHRAGPESTTASSAASANTPSAGPQTLTLTPEALGRAGVLIADASTSTEGAVLHVPGVVEPDAYRTVEVTPIVGGTVMSMSAVLGDTVTAGAVVARLRSPELTDDVRQWMTGRASQDAISRRLARTRQLAKIGAASQQEVEADQAELVKAATDVETARSKLIRLGFDDARLMSIAAGDAPPETIDIKAPSSGVVIRRTANPGQNVGPADSLITLGRIDRVWVMADVFERDLARIRIGQNAAVTAEGFPGRSWPGRIIYIEPELARESRTARARVEVDNPGGSLRFGMFVALTVTSGATPSHVMVPAAAIQTIGAVPVVYVELQPGQFTERPVLLGAASGDHVEIRSGLASGERVVVSGSFLLRSERDRLNWPPPVPAAPVPVATPVGTQPSSSSRPAPVVRRLIEVTSEGLTPSRVTVPAHQPVDLVFVRRVEDSCGEDILIPALGIKRSLPLNKAVTVRLPAREPGELTFSCGLDMLRGVIVVIGGL